ncbi:MAG: Omp28-related outer membrane protein [Flavobacteriales bacterium]|nr:Omp28-related outer membrane protein [Flavobacteriales bacterium]
MKPGKRSIFIMSLAYIVSVTINGQTDFDINPTNAGPVRFLTPGSYDLTFYARNNDINYPVTYFTACWQLDDGPVNCCNVSSAEMLMYDMLYPVYFAEPFMHCVPLEIGATGTYQLKYWTSDPEGNPDTNPSNDTLVTTIRVVDTLPARNMVMFEGTHQDCFPCGGMGEEQLNLILNTYPETVSMVSVHADIATDVLNFDEGVMFNDTFIFAFSGHPTFLFDLFTFPFYADPVSMFYWDQTEAVEWREAYPSPVALSFENVQYDAETISGDVRCTFYADMDESLSVNVLLTEDSIWGYQNGYPLGDSLYHRFTLWDFSAGIWGDNTVFPESINEGDEFVYSFELPVSETFNLDQLYLLAYVQHFSGEAIDSEIYNSAEIRLADQTVGVPETAERTLKLFPNPSDDQLYIQADDDVSSITFYNAQGQVFQLPAKKRLAGWSEIQVKELPAGIYFVGYAGKPLHKLIIQH